MYPAAGYSRSSCDGFRDSELSDSGEDEQPSAVLGYTGGGIFLVEWERENDYEDAGSSVDIESSGFILPELFLGYWFLYRLGIHRG